MFYCFRIMKKGKQFLCLAPQMKTQHMSNPAYTCHRNSLGLLWWIRNYLGCVAGRKFRNAVLERVYYVRVKSIIMRS